MRAALHPLTRAGASTYIRLSRWGLKASSFPDIHRSRRSLLTARPPLSAVSSGTGATGGADCVPTSGTLTFTPGQTSKVVNVTVNGDVANEGNDAVQVVLFNVSSTAVIQDGLGIGTIVNDDPLPVLSIGNATVTEGNAGTTVQTFTVTLSAGSGRTVQVNFASVNGSAKSGGLPAAGGADYTATSGTLTFNPGQTTQTISVTVNGDTTYETNEAYTVTLSSALNASLGVATGTGNIINDDAIPTLTIADVSLAEGTPALNTRNTTPFVFTVTLSHPSAQNVSVLYVTSDGTATTAGNDYNAIAGVLNIAAGATTGTITVLVRKDAVIEPAETFSVTLSSPNNATISDGTGVGTIVNDD